jgi:PIN like domain
LNFLFDHNTPPSWARSLDSLSKDKFDQKVGQVISLRDKFPVNAKDTDWLKALGEEGNWAVVSCDFFRKTKAERELIRQHGLSVFVLGKSWTDKHPFWPRTAQLVMWWPRIVDQANSVSNAAFEVPWRVSGKFVQIRL